MEANEWRINGTISAGKQLAEPMGRGLIEVTELTPTPSTIIPSDFLTLTARENLAKHVYYAKGSLNSSGAPASNGESVVTVPDLKGGKNLVYTGLSTPVISKRPPHYDDAQFSAIRFLNETNTKYEVNLTEQLPAPYEVSLTLISLPGAEFVPWTGGGNQSYLAVIGDIIRIYGSDDHMPGSKVPDYFKINNLHVIFNTDRGYLWTNGIYQGELPWWSVPGLKRTFNIIGNNANNPHWDFIALHVFQTLTYEQRQSWFQDLKDKFYLGQEKQLPRAENVQVTKSSDGNTLTASYDYVNPLGFPEDKSKTIYVWRERGPGANYIPDQKSHEGHGAVVNKNIFTTDGTNIKVEVQVFDTMGNTWRLISAFYGTLITHP